jgi:hypothetical protein
MIGFIEALKDWIRAASACMESRSWPASTGNYIVDRDEAYAKLSRKRAKALTGRGASSDVANEFDRKPLPSLVPVLLNASRPPAVSGLVSFLRINPVDAHSCWSFSHICVEGFEGRSPSGVNGNVLVPLRLVSSTLLEGTPGKIGPARFGEAVSSVPAATPEASAALGSGMNNGRRSNERCVATVAFAFPQPNGYPAWSSPSWDQPNNKEFSKPLTSKIECFHFRHEDTKAVVDVNVTAAVRQ